MNTNNMELFLTAIMSLVAILLACRFCGRLALLIGQPRVLGEMVAGVLLGPSLLGTISPGLESTLFPNEVKSVLYVLSNLGLALYMFLVGAEMDLNKISKNSIKKAGLLATSGIVPTFMIGVIISTILYKQRSMTSSNELTFAIFMGSALSITAFPMLARILQERGITKTRIGSLTLIAASIDDAAAWCLLAIVTAMAQSKSILFGLITAVGGVAFAIIVWFVIRPLLRNLGAKTERDGSLSQGDFAIILLLILGAAWFTDYIGIYSVFGGFMMGLAMPRNKVFQHDLHNRLSDLVVVFLVPIFFAYSGLNTKLNGLTTPGLFFPLIVIIVASILGKYGGCLFAMKGMGFDWRESSAIGGLMNSRGLMELILLNVGITYGIISENLFSILVLMAIITTALAMPIYNWSLPKKKEQMLKLPTSSISNEA